MTRNEIESLIRKYMDAFEVAEKAHDYASALKYITAVNSIQDVLLSLA